MIALLLSAALSISFLDGTASVQGHALHEGDLLHQGDTVETGPGARLEISFPNGSLVRLGENSRMTVGGDDPAGGRFSAKLFLGNLWAKVHKLLAANEMFQVETENGVAGVRGTEFIVSAGAEEVVRVYSGVVEVKSDRAGWLHRVESGNELRFARDRVPDGPHAFDEAADARDKFRSWVRRHDSEREHRLRELRRERLRRRLR